MLASFALFKEKLVNDMILKKVLKCIYEKGYIKVDEISQELHISKGLVEHIVQELKGKEYLKVVIPMGEKAYCIFCPLRSTCHIKTAGVIKSYRLTEKGKKLLGKEVGMFFQN